MIGNYSLFFAVLKPLHQTKTKFGKNLIFAKTSSLDLVQGGEKLIKICPKLQQKYFTKSMLSNYYIKHFTFLLILNFTQCDLFGHENH